MDMRWVYGYLRAWLAIEYPGAVYHVTSRGNERKAIYRDNDDREKFLALLGRMVEQFNQWGRV